MSGACVTPARQAAYEALQRARRKDEFASEVIGELIDPSDLSEPDKAFAAKLVLGVMRYRHSLDVVLDSHLAKPSKVKPDVRDRLRVAAFELLYLKKEPFHAVDQAVSAVGSVAPYMKGVANAVLRRVSEDAPSFPFGDPASDLDALALMAGVPDELSSALISNAGSEGAMRLIQTQMGEAPVFLHLSNIRGQAKYAAYELRAAGLSFEEVPDMPGCIKLLNASDIIDDVLAKLMKQGDVIVSDAAAQCVALQFAKAFKGGRLLEIGAGRGTKTCLIHSMLCHLDKDLPAEHVCVDASAARRSEALKKVSSCGVDVSRYLVADASNLDEMRGETFDTIFIDAPCTCTGTLRRHPEAMRRVSSQGLEQMHDLQVRIMRSAKSHLVPGGILVYSTCSMLDAENMDVMDELLREETDDGLHLQRAFQTAPSGIPMDMHFCAVMENL